MPYARRKPSYSRRPMRRRRRAAPSRGKVYGAAASQLYRDVQKLKNFVNVEFKNVDTNLATTVTDASPNVLPLNLLAEGDDRVNRNGDQVRFKSLQSDIKLTVGTEASNVRLLWVIDTKPNAGSLSTLAQILDLPTTDPTVGFRNLTNRTRYVILKDKQYHLSLGSDISSRNIELYKKMDMKTYYTGATAVITAVTSNVLLFCYCSDKPAGATAPTINSTHRLRFIDN